MNAGGRSSVPTKASVLPIPIFSYAPSVFPVSLGDESGDGRVHKGHVCFYVDRVLKDLYMFKQPCPLAPRTLSRQRTAHPGGLWFLRGSILRHLNFRCGILRTL